MKHKIIFILLVFSLIVCLITIFINIKVKNALYNEVIILKSNIIDCENNKVRAEEKLIQNIFSEDMILSNEYLVDFKYDSILLKNLINSTKLIYRFYKSSCMQCVEDELNIVKQLADSIGLDNIIIISDMDNINILKSMFLRKKIKSPYYICNKKFNLPIETDKYNIPSFFVLDTILRTRYVFKTGGNQKISDPYYKNIIKIFNRKQI